MSSPSRSLAAVRSDLIKSAFANLGAGTSPYALDRLHGLLTTVSDVSQLERAILAMAVSGRLVEQRAREGTSNELAGLRTWRTKKLKERGQKDNGALPDIDATEMPMEIPNSWSWARLGEITDLQIGRTPNRAENLFWDDRFMPFVSISDLVDGLSIDKTKEYVSERAFREIYRERVVPAGTLLYSFKLTIGKMSVTTMDAVHNEAIVSIMSRDHELRDYLFKALRAMDPTARTNNAVKGKTLNSKSIALLEVPLPPAAEQVRIVEALDLLLGLTSSLKSQLALPL